MGKGDRRNSMKMRQRRARAKKTAREARKLADLAAKGDSRKRRSRTKKK